MKRLASWLILLFFLYGIMEITAWVSYRLLFGENFSFSRMDGIREQTMAISATGINQSATPPIYLVHPYYGYVLNPNWYEQYQREHRGESGPGLIDEPINAYGFFGRTPSIQQSDPKKLVVAITGGSVAGFAATWGREEFTAGLSQIPAFRGREIVVLNFGAAAYKQPQQVMVIGDILAQGGAIDLLINIDGFNEIALPRGHDAFGSSVSPFFPQFWKLISETDFSRDKLMILGRIALVQEGRGQWARIFNYAPLRYNITATTAWKILDNNLVKRKNSLEGKLGRNTDAKQTGLIPTTEDQRTSLGPPVSLKDARALYEASASLWARGSVLLNNMVASQGGLYVHVLQPNQYFPGSRPGGADNTKTALDPASPYKPEVVRGYPYLRSAGKTLVESGINFYDLTTLFKDDPSPVYRDTCCHFTREGNAKLVKAIVARVRDAMARSTTPRLALFAEPDYRPNMLRTLALQPEGYMDGSGEELKRSTGH